MKYILMMSGNKEIFDWFAKWPKKDLEANFKFMQEFSKELKESGAFVASVGLAFPHEARLVTAGKNGEPVTDGVFPEAKEYLAGYWIIDVENEAEAYRWAARASMAPAPEGTPGRMPIEVRQVMSGPPKDLGL